MRSHWQRQHEQGMFRGAELPRLMTAIVMLGVMYMLIVRARDASMWRWLVGDGKKAPIAVQSDSPRPPGALPPAAGPTDEDADQREAAQEEFQAITDGTVNLGPEEMEAYDRLVDWVKNQPFARLYERAKKGLRYTDLYDDAERRRGDLVALNLVVCDAKDVGKNRFGVPLHEAWSTTDESRGRFYDAIIVDYPKKMPIGFNIRERAKFAGYFLKLHGYEPATAKPGQSPEKAPLLIGRLQWEMPAAAAEGDSTTEWIWGLGVVAVIALVLGVRGVYYRFKGRKPPARAMISDAETGEVIPIEQWLEQSGFGEDDRTDQ